MLFKNVLVVLISASFVQTKSKQKLVHIEDCDLPDEVYDKKNYVQHHLELYKDRSGQTCLKANFTVAKKTPTIFYHITGYKVRNGQKRLDFSAKNVSCRNPVIAIILKKLKVKYNERNCVGIPGNYTLPKFRADDLSTFYKYTVMGKGMYIFELMMMTEFGVVNCIRLTVDDNKYKY